MNASSLIVVGDLKLYPDGAVELGPHRFADPDQVRPAEYFDTRIRPAPGHRRDIVVEHEEEAYVFRFQPAQRQWRRDSLSREQLQAWTSTQRDLPSAPPQELPANETTASVDSAPSRIILKEPQVFPETRVDRTFDHLPVFKSHRGVANGKGSLFIEFRAPRRYVLKVTRDALAPATVAHAFVEHMQKAAPDIQLGFADYGAPNSSTGKEACDSLVLRCIRPLNRSSQAILDAAFKLQGKDLVVSLSQYDYSPRWTFLQLGVYSLTSLVIHILVMYSPAIRSLMPVMRWLAWLALVSFIAALLFGAVAFFLVMGGAFYRALRPEEQREAETLTAQVLSSFEDAVPKGVNIQPF